MSLSLPLQVARWLQGLELLQQAELASPPGSLVILSRNAAAEFENGVRVAQLLAQLQGGDDGEDFAQSTQLSQIKNLHTPVAKLYNWNVLLPALRESGVSVDPDMKVLIVAGDVALIADVLTQLHAAQQSSKQRVAAARRHAAPRAQDEVDDWPAHAPDAVGEAQTVAVAIAIACTQQLGVAWRETQRLLAEQGKHKLNMMLSQGQRADFAPAVRFVKFLFAHCKHLVWLCTRRSSEVEVLLSATRGALASADAAVALWASRLLCRFAAAVGGAHAQPSLWAWFSRADGGCSALVEAWRAHPELHAAGALLPLVGHFGAGHLTPLVLNVLPRHLTKPAAFYGFLLELMPMVGASEMKEELREGEGLERMLERAAQSASGGSADSAARGLALDFLATLWMIYPHELQAIRIGADPTTVMAASRAADEESSPVDTDDGPLNGVSSVLHELKRACRDADFEIQLTAHAALFRLLNHFATTDSYAAPILFKVLAFSLIENHHEPILRNFLSRNMQLALAMQPRIPVGVLLKPLVKQATLYGYNNTDFDFFVVLAKHERLGLRHALLMLQFLGKVCLNDALHGRVGSVPFLMLVERFASAEVLHDFLEIFVEQALAKLLPPPHGQKGGASETSAIRSTLCIELIAKLLHLSNPLLLQRICPPVTHAAHNFFAVRGVEHPGLVALQHFARKHGAATSLTLPPAQPPTPKRIPFLDDDDDDDGEVTEPAALADAHVHLGSNTAAYEDDVDADADANIFGHGKGGYAKRGGNGYGSLCAGGRGAESDASETNASPSPTKFSPIKKKQRALPELPPPHQSSSPTKATQLPSIRRANADGGGGGGGGYSRAAAARPPKETLPSLPKPKGAAAKPPAKGDANGGYGGGGYASRTGANGQAAHPPRLKSAAGKSPPKASADVKKRDGGDDGSGDWGGGAAGKTKALRLKPPATYAVKLRKAREAAAAQMDATNASPPQNKGGRACSQATGAPGGPNAASSAAAAVAPAAGRGRLAEPRPRPPIKPRANVADDADDSRKQKSRSPPPHAARTEQREKRSQIDRDARLADAAKRGAAAKTGKAAHAAPNLSAEQVARIEARLNAAADPESVRVPQGYAVRAQMTPAELRALPPELQLGEALSVALETLDAIANDAVGVRLLMPMPATQTVLKLEKVGGNGGADEGSRGSRMPVPPERRRKKVAAAAAADAQGAHSNSSAATAASEEPRAKPDSPANPVGAKADGGKRAGAAPTRPRLVAATDAKRQAAPTEQAAEAAAAPAGAQPSSAAAAVRAEVRKAQEEEARIKAEKESLARLERRRKETHAKLLEMQEAKRQAEQAAIRKAEEEARAKEEEEERKRMRDKRRQEANKRKLAEHKKKSGAAEPAEAGSGGAEGGANGGRSGGGAEAAAAPSAKPARALKKAAEKAEKRGPRPADGGAEERNGGLAARNDGAEAAALAAEAAEGRSVEETAASTDGEAGGKAGAEAEGEAAAKLEGEAEGKAEGEAEGKAEGEAEGEKTETKRDGAAEAAPDGDEPHAAAAELGHDGAVGVETAVVDEKEPPPAAQVGNYAEEAKAPVLPSEAPSADADEPHAPIVEATESRASHELAPDPEPGREAGADTEAVAEAPPDGGIDAAPDSEVNAAGEPAVPAESETVPAQAAD